MHQGTPGATAPTSLRKARLASRSAQYDAALEHLEGCEDWGQAEAESAVALKADVITRRDPVGAARYLATVDDIPVTPSGRFELALQWGKTLATLRDYASAESRYADARALAGEVPDGDATLAYHVLRLRWLRRDCDPRMPEAASAVAHPDPSVAAAALSTRAWMHAFCGDYQEHIGDLRRCVAYASMKTEEPVDVGVLAYAIHSLAQAGFEMADEGAVASARTAFEALAWTDDVRAPHFLATRALGWDAFMRGRPGPAQWAFKDARAIAPSIAWEVMSHLDRAYVARMSGNEVWATEELAHADRLAHEVRWESNFDEARQVLVVLAVMHAPSDASRAQRYAALYSQIGTENVSPAFAVNGDRRAHAHALYAQGRIDQMLGRRDAAVTALQAAYEIFESASFHYRAAMAATALAEITADETWQAKALHHARSYPNCPLAAIVDESVSRAGAMPPNLTALQQQIARALFTGVEAQELSRRFSRSLYTIERQIALIHEAFGVTSRKALLEEAHRRNLI